MGMRYEARMLTAEQAGELAADPSQVETVYAEQPQPADAIDLDKSWHGLHWLLTGDVDNVDGPAGIPIMGGRSLRDDWGWGPAQLIDTDDVRRADQALASVTEEDLRARFDAGAMRSAGVYPDIWDEEDVFDSDLALSFAALKDFYSRAAARGSAVLVSIG